LVTHKTLGPPIQAWQDHRAIARPVKKAATVSLGVVFGLSIFMNIPWWALTAQGVILLCVAFFIWRTAEIP
ncbi:MAG: DUF454 domain-containing protein, partial [Gammaproteobacteria bacterium]|nr:DUF454 domain-containing protein [Gammaproteobacteria bacterium]